MSSKSIRIKKLARSRRERRIAYTVLYVGALASVATFPWALLCWNHALVSWDGGIILWPRLLLSFLAFLNFALIFKAARYINDNDVQLYREDARLLNIFSLFATPLIAWEASDVSRRFLFPPNQLAQLAYALTFALSALPMFWFAWQLFNLRELSWRYPRSSTDDAPVDSLQLAVKICLGMAVWVGLILGAEYFDFEHYAVSRAGFRAYGFIFPILFATLVTVPFLFIQQVAFERLARLRFTHRPAALPAARGHKVSVPRATVSHRS